LSALIFDGIIAGLILSTMLGPAFFMLMEVSIRRGVRAGLAFDIGIFISDIVYILVALIFYSQVAKFVTGNNQGLVQILVGVVFIFLGMVTYLKKPKEVMVDEVGNVIHSSKDYFILALKGFLLNMANPLIILYWFIVITEASKHITSAESWRGSIFIYLSVILGVYFVIDFIKILIAKRLRSLITQRILETLNQFIGVIFLLFGIILIARGVLNTV
jgi:threonine/homoserine/homoserine lactone efflux protein